MHGQNYWSYLIDYHSSFLEIQMSLLLLFPKYKLIVFISVLSLSSQDKMFEGYLVDRAHSEPTATTYLAGPQPTYSKAMGRGLFSSSR